MTTSNPNNPTTSENAADRPPTAAKNGHPENREGADQATKDNDLTTGHAESGDGGDANSKKKKS